MANLQQAALTIIAQPIINALDSIEKDPTPLNVAVQFAAVQANVVATLPALESLGIADVAANLKKQITDYIGGINPPAA